MFTDSEDMIQIKRMFECEMHDTVDGYIQTTLVFKNTKDYACTYELMKHLDKKSKDPQYASYICIVIDNYDEGFRIENAFVIGNNLHVLISISKENEKIISALTNYQFKLINYNYSFSMCINIIASKI